MDRTKKLLAGVTASMLLTGATGEIESLNAKETVLAVSPQVPQPSPDPKVIETAKAISDVLLNVPEQNALTLNELLAKRPALNRTTTQKALDYLRTNGEIRRTGDGTQYKPYRYYDKYRGSGSHGG